jgi:Kdo2-lipid IVA lauroyltransferase/acyltransferase
LAEQVRLKHRVEYAGFRAGLAAGSLLTERQAAIVGGAAGGLGYRLGIKRGIVVANLRTAFPDASDDWIESTAAAAFRHLGRETLMMLRLSTMSRAEILERTHIADEGLISTDYQRGLGIVAASGHIGNWEIGAAGVAARGYRLAAIGKRAANPLFYANIMAARERMGFEIIDLPNATRGGLRALRDGKALAMVADQHAGGAGLWLPFFGRPASTFRGPALLALRTGAPMYLVITLRRPDDVYEVRVRPIDTTATGDMEADVRRVMLEYTRLLEAAVRADPDQYLWHHRRWRQPPSGADSGPEQ